MSRTLVFSARRGSSKTGLGSLLIDRNWILEPFSSSRDPVLICCCHQLLCVALNGTLEHSFLTAQRSQLEYETDWFASTLTFPYSCKSMWLLLLSEIKVTMSLKPCLVDMYVSLFWVIPYYALRTLSNHNHYATPLLCSWCSIVNAMRSDLKVRHVPCEILHPTLMMEIGHAQKECHQQDAIAQPEFLNSKVKLMRKAFPIIKQGASCTVIQLLACSKCSWLVHRCKSWLRKMLSVTHLNGIARCMVTLLPLPPFTGVMSHWVLTEK